MNDLCMEAEEKSFFDGLISLKDYNPFPRPDDRSFWNSISDKLKKLILTEAESYSDFDWPGIRASDILDYFRSGIRHEERAGEKRRGLMLLTLAECIKNDGSYMKDIINGVWSVCEETCWSAAAHIDTCGGTKDGLPRHEEKILDLRACETAQLIAFIYYALKDKLNAESIVIAERIRYELYNRIIEPYLVRDDYWWIGKMGRRLNNWNPWCNSNVLFSVCCICDGNVRRRIIEKIVISLNDFLAGYPDDGACDEGTSYWFKAGGKFINALEMLNSVSENKLNLNNIHKVKKIADFILDTRLCENYYLNFADGSARIEEPDIYILYAMGKLFGDSDFCDEAKALSSYKTKLIIEGYSVSAWEIMRYIKYYDEINGITLPKVKKDRSVWFESTQICISRMYNNSGGEFIIAAKGGTNGDSHNHNDIGNFIVYNNASPVIIDVGVGTYTRDTFNEKRYTIWTMQSQYHNLPIINETGQHEGIEYTAENVYHNFSEEKDEVGMSIHNAYEDTLGIIEWNRRFVIERTDSYAEVTDEFELENESKIEFILMLCNKPYVEGNRIIVSGCHIEVMCDYETEIICEKMAMNDPKMIKEWGEQLFRIHIKIKKKIKRGFFALRIKQGS